VSGEGFGGEKKTMHKGKGSGLAVSNNGVGGRGEGGLKWGEQRGLGNGVGRWVWAEKKKT